MTKRAYRLTAVDLDSPHVDILGEFDTYEAASINLPFIAEAGCGASSALTSTWTASGSPHRHRRPSAGF
jgi:hypothetical protein